VYQYINVLIQLLKANVSIIEYQPSTGEPIYRLDAFIDAAPEDLAFTTTSLICLAYSGMVE
jgi:hypothetical protein